ncbi:type I secretion system permease/ATPase [Martelella lutilitoris]|uniref:Type I secretion system permease/ATPase n=1 Tax=Martelella lutilitoris TaxID=2583532 RepID=A0A7T7HKT9_9HYPH|nr:type I secretion system permease/ATPase [Martelella lutilitoris]QQM30982.1 type I secretion system permease/ATPase [Martelella lutilitoris]
MLNKKGNKNRELLAAIGISCKALGGVAVFSAVVNILALTGTLFMLQVYDRVIPSHSGATLLALFALVVLLYLMMGILDNARSRVLARVGARFQDRLDERAFRIVLKQSRLPSERQKPAVALNSLGTIQGFLASPLPGAIFDLPWVPFFLTIMFAFSVWLGLLGLAGALVVTALAVANQWLTRRKNADAHAIRLEADAETERTRKQLETILGLGMVDPFLARWKRLRAASLEANLATSDISGRLTSASKAVRQLLQSAALGLGAVLVLAGHFQAGAMIACSILLGRALAPIEQVIGQWGLIQRAWEAWKNLSVLFEAIEDETQHMPLPRPEARIDVEAASVVPPGERKPVLQAITFSLTPGKALAVIGPCAAGKSSLARALTGVWPAAAGIIRLGGADINEYPPDTLGRYLGYLPQTVTLFPGTVAQNIARFDENPDPDTVVRAAQKAGAHQMILDLPMGYDTLLTEGESLLSGGQRQRLGLARALYGNPLVLVLDEPNASLDDDGLRALNGAIAEAKADGRAVILMSHRPSALAECDSVLVLEKGHVRACGPRDEVLSRIAGARMPNVVAGGGH